MDAQQILADVVLILAAAALVAVALRRIGVPPIIGLIVAGIAAGPAGLAIVPDGQHVDLLSEIGVALLLFGIGLELTPAKLRRLLRPVTVGGTLQVGLTFSAVAGGAWFLGLAPGTSAFLGFVFALSSTALVLRGLESRGQLGQPHGRLALGILVFQDLCVVPMVLLVPVLAGGAMELRETFAALGLKAAAIVGVVVAARLVLPRALAAVAATRERELFVLMSVLACLGTAWVASLAGVSLALGAFLGGVAVASSEYRHQTLAEVVPLREVLTSVFFVSVGMFVDPAALLEQPAIVAGLLATALLVKALLTFLAATIGGFRPRAGAGAALALAQVGEFSFVLLHAGRGTPLLPPELEQPLLASVALSMLATPVLLQLAPRIGALAERSRLLRRLSRRDDLPGDPASREGPEAPVIVAGYGLTGRAVVEELRKRGVTAVVLDLNPENVRSAREAGMESHYGDATDPTLLRRAGAARARSVVVSINDERATERAVRAARAAAPQATITVRAVYDSASAALSEAGADSVVSAEALSALEVARVVARCHDAPHIPT